MLDVGGYDPMAVLGLGPPVVVIAAAHPLVRRPGDVGAVVVELQPWRRFLAGRTGCA